MSPGNVVGAPITSTATGYSACPDAYNEMASVLQDACLDIYSFLLPGHGHNLIDVPSNSSPVTSDPDLTGNLNHVRPARFELAIS